MSIYFSSGFNITCVSLPMPFYIYTFIEDFLTVDWEYRSYVVAFLSCETWADFNMINFDVIMGMN